MSPECKEWFLTAPASTEQPAARCLERALVEMPLGAAMATSATDGVGLSFRLGIHPRSVEYLLAHEK